MNVEKLILGAFKYGMSIAYGFAMYWIAYGIMWLNGPVRDLDVLEVCVFVCLFNHMIHILDHKDAGLEV